MQLSILFNYPLGHDSARVSIGAANINDANYQFRFSILASSKDSNEWLSPGWVNYDDISKLQGYIKRSSIIRIEKRDKSNQDIGKKYEWDCSKIWPPEADGKTVVNINYFI